MGTSEEADPDLSDWAVYQMRLRATRIGVRERRIRLEFCPEPEPTVSPVGKL